MSRRLMSSRPLSASANLIQRKTQRLSPLFWTLTDFLNHVSCCFPSRFTTLSSCAVVAGHALPQHTIHAVPYTRNALDVIHIYDLTTTPYLLSGHDSPIVHPRPRPCLALRIRGPSCRRSLHHQASRRCFFTQSLGKPDVLDRAITPDRGPL